MQRSDVLPTEPAHTCLPKINCPDDRSIVLCLRGNAMIELGEDVVTCSVIASVSFDSRQEVGAEKLELKGALLVRLLPKPFGNGEQPLRCARVVSRIIEPDEICVAFGVWRWKRNRHDGRHDIILREIIMPHLPRRSRQIRLGMTITAGFGKNQSTSIVNRVEYLVPDIYKLRRVIHIYRHHGPQ